MFTAEARSASLAAKAASQQGRDPHRERLASLASATAQRSIVPKSVGEAAAVYAQTISAREHLSDRTRRKIVHYLKKALRIIGGESIALAAIDTPAVRLMIDAVNSSPSERREVFEALNKFMDWCVKRGLIPINPCAGIDRADRPRGSRSRDHTPSVATLRRAWDAIEDAPDHVRALIRFLLLVPLRREEAQGLLWSEVDLDEKRIAIRAERMKNRQVHTLPLSAPALAILADCAACRAVDDRVFASPSGARAINWTHWVTRIRVALGEDGFERSRRFNLHDVRRSFVSQLAERDFDVDLLDQCLSHSRKGVLGVYQRSSRWREREAAMAAWAELVAPSVDDRDNVVPIRAR
jgi:integrase